MKKSSILLALVMLVSTLSFGQQLPKGMELPKGVKVAIEVFEDLECPACRNAEQPMKDAEKSEQVPLIRHDFPLGPSHPWSGKAALYARYFDTVSPALGEEYRHWLFQNQPSINVSNLTQMTSNFAGQHKTGLPFSWDPSGALQAKINADSNLGHTLNVTQTPTIFIVGDVKNSPPIVQLKDATELIPAIQNMKRAVVAEESAHKSTKSAKSSSKKK